MKPIKLLKYLLPAALVVLIGTGIFLWPRLTRGKWTARDGKAHCYLFADGVGVDSLTAWLERDYEPANHWRWSRDLRSLDTLMPGYYRFESTMTNHQIIAMLSHGRQTDYRLTLSANIRTLPQLAARISRTMQTDSLAVIDAIHRHVDTTAWTPQTVISIFIPNTYFVHWTDSADLIVARMQREYERFWNPTRRHLADSIGFSPTQIMTLASIVSSETNHQDEWPTIASLYINRLRRDMKLQADPTVVYATGEFGTRRVLNRHIRHDSPYNTYLYRGLPPGPIRCVRPECIDSVLHAPATGYIYMCANPDWSGTHIFTSRYSDHQRVAREFQRELNRRNIRR